MIEPRAVVVVRGQLLRRRAPEMSREQLAERFADEARREASRPYPDLARVHYLERRARYFAGFTHRLETPTDAR